MHNTPRYRLGVEMPRRRAEAGHGPRGERIRVGADGPGPSGLAAARDLARAATSAGSGARLRRVGEHLTQLTGRGQARAGPTRASRRQATRRCRDGECREAERSKPSRSARSNAGRASSRRVTGRPGSSAGTRPSMSGVPASQTSPSASSAAGSAVSPENAGCVASIPIPAAPMSASSRDRRAGRAAVHDHRHAQAGDEVAQRVLRLVPGTDRDRPVARRRGQRAGQHGRQVGSSSCTSTWAPGAGGHLGDVGAQAPQQARGELAHRTAVGQYPMPGAQLHARRERPRPGRLHLHPGRAAPARSASSNASRSARIRSTARRWSRPGRAVTR